MLLIRSVVKSVALHSMRKELESQGKDSYAKGVVLWFLSCDVIRILDNKLNLFKMTH